MHQQDCYTDWAQVQLLSAASWQNCSTIQTFFVILTISYCLIQHSTIIWKHYDSFSKHALTMDSYSMQRRSSSANHQQNFLDIGSQKNGITITEKHIQCIRDLQPPTDRQSLKRFLGIINYNAKYCPNASIILRPLYKLTSSKVNFQGDKPQKTFSRW